MKRKTIRNHRDFFVPQNGLSVATDCFFAKAKPAKIPCDARYGLIVSKRNFKFAVQRNRAKRLMRDWITANEDLMSPELDYVFVVYKPVLDCDCENGRKQIKSALSKILKIYEKNAKESQ